MTSTHNFYEYYKPLRNHLRKVCIEDSLFVIWAYVQHLQFNTQIPPEIKVSREFLSKEHRAEKGIYSWELELITKEIIINSQERQRCHETLRKWSYCAKTITKLKFLEEAIAKKYINQNNIQTELYRIAHRQFPWQSPFFKDQLIRYYKIFKHPDIERIIRNKTGLTLYELYFIGYAFFGSYLKDPAIVYPIDVSINEISRSNVDKFLCCFSKELLEIKSLITTEQEIGEKYAYSYSSLRAFPIIKMKYREKLSIVCPLPTLLLWRITTGLYYEILHEDNFGVYFGASYQDFVGKIIEKSNNKKKISYISESEYYVGNDRKDTVDWIACDAESALFIECKTKRLILQAKVELEDTNFIQVELEKMAQFILQIYKTIDDYRNNHYPSFTFDKNIQIFPLIVTLEDWYLFGERLIVDLRDQLEQQIKKTNLPLSYLEDIPYSICSIEEFEDLMQIIQLYGVQSVMKDKVYDKEKMRWNFKTFLETRFGEELKSIEYLFEEDYKSLFGQFAQSAI